MNDDKAKLEKLRADIASIGKVRPVRVLVVDDEPDQRLLINDLLANYNVMIGEANDGQSALDALVKESYDVVLLDVKMPGMDGLKVHKVIKESWPGVKVFLCTGHVEFPGLSVALESGYVQVIGKEFLAKSLAGIFEPLCKTHIT